MESGKYRSVFLYKNYFNFFFEKQRQKVKDKILWTLKAIEELPQVPENYLKHLTGTEALYEIRIQSGGDIFRIFCFFDNTKLIILANGFHKKTQKTPRYEVERALKIKRDYYAEKEQNQEP